MSSKWRNKVMPWFNITAEISSRYDIDPIYRSTLKIQFSSDASWKSHVLLVK